MKTAPLPPRAGLAPCSLQLPAGQWSSLLAFLESYFPDAGYVPWTVRMARGEVAAGDGARLTATSPYRPGLRVWYYREPGPEAPLPYLETVIHRDAHLLIVDKPPFVPVVPAGRHLRETLLVRLRERFDLPELVPLHRLDRLTAGLVAFSVEPATRAAYAELFPLRAVEKIYEAIAPVLPAGTLPAVRHSRLGPGEPFFRMRETAGPPNAETYIEELERRGGLARYRLRPVTGRKHQLRVHLAALGAPILNDPLYPELLPETGDDPARPLALLARELHFRDPLSGEARGFTSRRTLAFPDATPASGQP